MHHAAIGKRIWSLAALTAFLIAAPAASADIQDCPDCPALVVIPAQTVRIGVSDDVPDRRATERAATMATIARPFAMAKTEVTRAQYAAFVAAARYTPPVGTQPGCNYFNGIYGYVADHDWRNPGFAQRESEPVLCVSYHDAAAYAAWLTKRTGRAYRVPSSVEWEVAARAGATTAWPWGNASEKSCEFANIADQTYQTSNPKRPTFACDDSLAFTSPVARYKPNAYGLFDMIGNAWEWTADCWRDDLSGAPVDGRALGAGDGADCTYRNPVGGGWVFMAGK